MNTKVFVNKVIFLNQNTLKNKIEITRSDNIFFLLNRNLNVNKNINITIKPNIKVNLFLYLLCGQNNIKLNFNICHGSYSDVNFISKTFLTKKCKCKIDVQSNISKHSIKTIANQKFDAYLLSETNQIDITPSLVINTNLTKASHSVNIYKHNPDKLHYLMSKGIDKKKALQILFLKEFEWLKLIYDKNIIYNSFVNKIRF